MKKRVFSVIFMILLCVVALLGTMTLFGCSDDLLISIVVDGEGELYAGTTTNISANLDGTSLALKKYASKDAIFEVTNGNAAYVDVDGLLVIDEKAEAGSKFTLTVTIGDKKISKDLTVAISHVSSIKINVDSKHVKAGDIVDLAVRVYPSQAAGRQVTYFITEGEDVASIDGSKLYVSNKADASNTIKVKALSDGIESATCVFDVDTIQATAVFVDVDRTTMLPGEAQSIRASVVPNDTTYSLVCTITKGMEYCDFGLGTLWINDNAPMGAEIEITAEAGLATYVRKIYVSCPSVESISTNIGSGGVLRGEEVYIAWAVAPSDATEDNVVVRPASGLDYITWTGDLHYFTVNNNAPLGSEIVFEIFDNVADVYTTAVFIVTERTLESLSINASPHGDYLAVNDSVLLSYASQPAEYVGTITYRIVEGGELATLTDDMLTIKKGAGVGSIKVVAEAEDGTCSEALELAVRGRYVRKVFTAWNKVAVGTDSYVWLVLPKGLMDAAGLTVLVPATCVDIIIEGAYDGTPSTTYKDLYFYFRNASSRKVTLSSFATEATMGFGGVVIDLGSSGETEVAIQGDCLVKADSPYMIDTTGEIINGNRLSQTAQTPQGAALRNGKQGYNGAMGGTAIQGYRLTFSGDGNLKAVAGNGTDGTIGGNGGALDSAVDGVLAYVGSNGAPGGNGGDSGCAISAYIINFKYTGTIICVAGNAGKGGLGGKAGATSALVGDYTVIPGENGSNGRNGLLKTAVQAEKTVGEKRPTGEKAIGTIQSSNAVCGWDIIEFANKISAFYGVTLHYGSDLYNPYANKVKASRYTMVTQTDSTELLRQANSLYYTMSIMPKNCWAELQYYNGRMVNIYLVKSMTSGAGSVIYGLTNNENHVWFATFNSGIRGIQHSGYFNVMLHEFMHAFHYNMDTASMEKAYGAYNKNSLGATLKYGTSSDNSYVYGMAKYGTEVYGAKDSCFLTAYSRKTEKEDVSETVSLIATLTARTDYLYDGMPIYEKYKIMCTGFCSGYETLKGFNGGRLFIYPHIFEEFE